MVQYLRKLADIPGFSEIPLPGHEETKTVNKVLIDPVTGSQNFMLVWAQLEAGSGAALHTHPVEQAFFILSGTLKVRIAGEEYIAEANSAVLIPPGVEHETMAEGKEPVVILGVFAPPMDSFASRPH